MTVSITAKKLYDCYNHRVDMKKYDNMTAALAENDITLLKAIDELALDSDIQLSREALILILRAMPGYDDSSYRDNYFNSPDNDPTPPHIEENEIRGKRAPFIRFWDTNARKAARNAALQQAWEDIRDNRPRRQNPAMLFAPNESSDSETASLLEVVVDTSSRCKSYG